MTDSRKVVAFPFRLSASQLWRLLAVLGAGALLLLIGTWLAHRPDFIWGWLPYELRFLIEQSDLRRERVLGAWLSSLLFVLTAPAAVLAFGMELAAVRSWRGRLLATSWLGLAGLALALSLSELGTLHEASDRLVSPRLGFQGHGWVGLLAIPALVAGVGLIWFVWRWLRSHQPAFRLFLAGALLFLTVPLQERLEFSMRLEARAQGEPFRRPLVFTLLEEGAELFGAILLFGGTAFYLVSRARTLIDDGAVPVAYTPAVPGRTEQPDQGLILLPSRAVVGSVASVLLLFTGGLIAAGRVEGLLEERFGRPGDPVAWFPATLATLTAGVFLYLRYGYRSLGSDAVGRRPVLLLAALFALLVGANYGGGSAITATLWEGNPRWQAAVDIAFVMTAIGIAAMLWSGGTRSLRIALVTWLAFLTPTFVLPPGHTAKMLGFFAFGALLMGLALQWTEDAAAPRARKDGKIAWRHTPASSASQRGCLPESDE